MKRTTYILIGILISLLVLLVAGVFYISMQKSGDQKFGPVFPDKLVQADFTGIHVVKIYATDSRPVRVDGMLTLADGSADSTRLSYPESEYLQVSRQADTLVVHLDFSKWEFPKKTRKDLFSTVYVDKLPLNLQLGSGVDCIISKVCGMQVVADRLQRDSIAIQASEARVTLDTCSLRSFSLAGRDVWFRANGTNVQNLHLDLDALGDWKLKECTVDTEYLTGSGKHHNNLQKGECRLMLWTPKSEGAELSVTLPEKGCVMLQPEDLVD